MSPHDRVEGFFALPDRSALILVATYEGTTIVDRREMAVGPRSPSSWRFLARGWSPCWTATTPTSASTASPDLRRAADLTLPVRWRGATPRRSEIRHLRNALIARTARIAA
jgi:hypothetical protein